MTLKMNKKLLVLILPTALVVSWWGYRMTRKVYVSTIDKNDEIDVTARTIWGEARGEGVDGMQAVANVIANRVKKGGWYGETFRDVCTKTNQFSCWLESDPNYLKLQSVTTNDYQFRVAMEFAKGAVAGTLKDITGGATNYHAEYANPTWAQKMAQTTVIGKHLFYV